MRCGNAIPEILLSHLVLLKILSTYKRNIRILQDIFTLSTEPTQIYYSVILQPFAYILACAATNMVISNILRAHIKH